MYVCVCVYGRIYVRRKCVCMCVRVHLTHDFVFRSMKHEKMTDVCVNMHVCMYTCMCTCLQLTQDFVFHPKKK